VLTLTAAPRQEGGFRTRRAARSALGKRVCAWRTATGGRRLSSALPDRPKASALSPSVSPASSLPPIIMYRLLLVAVLLASAAAFMPAAMPRRAVALNAGAPDRVRIERGARRRRIRGARSSDLLPFSRSRSLPSPPPPAGRCGSGCDRHGRRAQDVPARGAGGRGEGQCGVREEEGVAALVL